MMRIFFGQQSTDNGQQFFCNEPRATSYGQFCSHCSFYLCRVIRLYIIGRDYRVSTKLIADSIHCFLNNSVSISSMVGNDIL